MDVFRTDLFYMHVLCGIYFVIIVDSRSISRVFRTT